MSIRYQCDRCDADLDEAGTCELSFSASKPHVITPLTATMHLCVNCGDAVARGLQLLLQKTPQVIARKDAPLMRPRLRGEVM
jgi:hypothetical protein